MAKKEYIEREAAIEAAYQGLKRPSNTEKWKRICEQLKNVPAADVVEVRHGRWKHGREAYREYHGDCLAGVLYDRWTCSECGYVVDDHKYFAINYNFCPHCGAKMTREYVAYYDGVYETRSRK